MPSPGSHLGATRRHLIIIALAVLAVAPAAAIVSCDTPLYSVPPGGSCGEDIDCMAGSCVNGACSEGTLGSACNDDLQCDGFGYVVCMGGVCCTCGEGDEIIIGGIAGYCDGGFTSGPCACPIQVLCPGWCDEDYPVPCDAGTTDGG